MRFILLIALVTSFKLTFSQNSNDEFEGKIYYQNSFKFDNSKVDSIELINGFGSSSVYSYKRGKYHWASFDSRLEYEVFNSDLKLMIDKYSNTDSLDLIDVYNKGDSLLSYTINDRDTVICGYRCKSIRLILSSRFDGSEFIRTLYYSPELRIDPIHFEGVKSYAGEFAYKLIKSVPLKIEMEFTSFPLLISIYAVHVEKSKIDDSLFLINRNLIKK